MTRSSSGAGRKRSAARAARGVRRGALFAFVYLVLLYHISAFIGDDMALATMSLAMAIVEERSCAIDSYVHDGWEISYREDHFYSGMPPGQSFVAVPLYGLLRPAIRAAAPMLAPHLSRLPPSRQYGIQQEHIVRKMILLVLFQVLVALPVAALVPVLIYDLMHEVGSHRGGGPLLLLLLPMATLWWTYGATSGPRTMGGCLVVLPVWWLAVRRERLNRSQANWEATLLGAGLALAPLIRYELLLPVLVVAGYCALRMSRREMAGLMAAGVALAMLGLLYHNRCYGGPLRTAYSAKLYPESRLQRDWGVPTENLVHVEIGRTTYVVWNNEQVVRPTIEPLVQGLYQSREALLRFSPFLLLVPWGLWLLWQQGERARELALMSGGMVLTALLVLSLMPHPGFRGWVGPRYLLWAMPFGVFLASAAWGRLPVALRWILFAASFVPCYLAAMFGSRLESAYDLGLVRQFGLSNYVLSRAQEAGMAVTPGIATAISLLFWAMMAFVFLRPRSGWYLFPVERGAAAKHPQDTGGVAPDAESALRGAAGSSDDCWPERGSSSAGENANEDGQ